MTIVFVHGSPETYEIWESLRKKINQDTIAVELPGFGNKPPNNFKGTKDGYVDWLVKFLEKVDQPIDLVGHDIGALFVMRIISHFDVPIRSWVADVAPNFHPKSMWHEGALKLQTPSLGEDILKKRRESRPDNPESTSYRLNQVGVPKELAYKIGKAHDESMSKCILEFYRSAIPNVAKDWWSGIKPNINSKGLVLLLPDPPEDEQMSLEVAEKLGAKTVRLDDLNHCWMAENPEHVYNVLKKFLISDG